MSENEPLLPRLRRYDSSTVVSANNLGTLNGVYIPCLMNILGIILFMRLSWAVGQAGWLNVLLMFLVGELAAILTVFSMSALISTGKVRGGGSYFLLSRCLGPEIGGAIGVFFYLAYAVGTSFYVVSLGTEIVDAFYTFDEEFNAQVLANQTKLAAQTEVNRRNHIAFFGSVALWLVTLVSYAGAGSFAKINLFVFSLQVGCILVGLVSIWFFADNFNQQQLINHTFEQEYGISDSPTDLLFQTMYSNYTFDPKCGNRVCSTRVVFGIVFNAITGIMEGANLSGDLRDPTRSIPRGTLYAIITAITLYVVLIFSFSTKFPRQNLQKHADLLEKVTQPSHLITVVGIIVAAFSAALGSLFGGARVLQALGKDNLPPKIGLSFFAKGTEKSNEPRRAVLFTFVVAQLCTLGGDLDFISPIIASFFLITYASVNLTCLLLDLSGTPNFRPTFRWFSKNQSFFGALLSFAILVYLNANYALYAILLVSFLVIYISWQLHLYPELQKNWGDVAQALIYHQVRKYLYRLDHDKHPKHWRPSILFLLPSKVKMSSQETDFGTFDEGELGNQIVTFEDTVLNLLKFGNILKSGGLFMTGQVLLREEQSYKVTLLKEYFVEFFKVHLIKAIPNFIIANSFKDGYFSLASLSGLGGLSTNTVLVDVSAMEVMQSYDEYFTFLQETVSDLQKNVLLSLNFNMQEEEVVVSSWFSYPTSFVNVVILEEEFYLGGTLALQIQLAFVLSDKLKGSKLRLIALVRFENEIVNTLMKLKELALMARIPEDKVHFKVLIFEVGYPLINLACFGSKSSLKPNFSKVNKLLKDLVQQDISEDAQSKVFFLPLNLKMDIDGTLAHQQLLTLTNDLPRVVMTCLGEEKDVISQKL